MNNRNQLMTELKQLTALRRLRLKCFGGVGDAMTVHLTDMIQDRLMRLVTS